VTDSTRGDEWFFTRGSLAQGGWESVVDDAREGWSYTGIRVAELAGGFVTLDAVAVERIIVPLAGSFTVEYSLSADAAVVSVAAGVASASTAPVIQKLAGRASVFHGPTDTLYLPTGTAATITGSGRVSVAEAPTQRAYPVAYLPATEVPVELRGAGRSSRQVQNFGTPAALEADRLIACEVITPAENWSSYPPHKHDVSIPGVEAQLEEIYYFETAVTRGASAPATAESFGYLRTYASDAGPIDILEEVHSGDIALVPRGWHGPCVAAPGYDLYYLNVMAGPDPDRVWAISDDPAHAWIRDTWVGQEFDSRLPYTA
jgi:5-deoxy-glucuronate isomerase